MRTVRGIGIILVAGFGLVMFNSAQAAHEADHRYEVMGYVLDEQEKPKAGASVVIRLNNKVMATGKTSSGGYFSMLVHLHDSHFGQMLDIRSGKSRGRVRINFTRGDKSARRVHHVNFIGARLTEGKLSRRGFPTWGYGAVAAVVLIPAAILVGRRNRRPAAAARKGKGKGEGKAAKGAKRKKKGKR